MIPKIEEEPEYKSINKMMQLLYTNTDTLPTPKGEGHYRHIGIIIKPEIYTSFSVMECINPPNPGVYSTVPMNSTMIHQDQIQLYHNKGRIIYNNKGMMGEALNIQVIGSVYDTYSDKLK